MLSRELLLKRIDRDVNSIKDKINLIAELKLTDATLQDMIKLEALKESYRYLIILRNDISAFHCDDE